MYIIFVLSGFLTGALSLCAGESRPAIQTLEDFFPGLSHSDFRAPEIPERKVAERGNLTWSHYSREYYADGGLQFEYSGRKYAIKLGFMRGEYDPYIKNYKAVPGVLVTDITGEKYTTWGIKRLSEIQNTDSLFTSDMNEGLFNVGYYNNTVYVRTPSWANIASFGYPSLRTAWETNAEKYSRYTEKNKTYFVPQSYWDPGTRRRSYGYVISEYAPYYPQSGVPLDYMELFSGSNPYEYKPRTYCIPLGLSFRHKGKEGKPWEWGIKDLTPDDLQDALADEIKGGRIALPALFDNEPSGRTGE